MNTSKSIRDSVVSRLINNTAALDRVYSTPIDPNFIGNLPMIGVFTPSVVAEGLIEKDRGDADQRVTTTIEIDVLNGATTNWTDEVDDIITDIKTLLFTDKTWVDQFVDIPTYNEEHSLFENGEKPIATGIVKIQVIYFEDFVTA